jgi:hypothetical protein
MGIQDSERKLAELIIYVSQKCACDASFGGTKLNKILFFSDFSAYGKRGKSITGCDYQRIPAGPAPRRLVPVRDALIEAGHLVMQPVFLASGLLQKRLVNLREPDLTLFGGEEIAIVDEWIDRLFPMTAKAVSNLSHKTAAYQSVEDGESIDIRTVFLSVSDPTPAEIARGQKIAEKLGLLA